MATVSSPVELVLDHIEIQPIGSRFQLRVCYWDAENGRHIFNGHDTPLYGDRHAAQVAAEELGCVITPEGETRQAPIVWR